MGPNTMIYWLAQAAKELREAHEPRRKQVHIAASMSADQSTIYRFEQGRAWPKRTDVIVAAYADDLDIDDPRVIWRKALDMWEAQGEVPTLADLLSQSPAQEFEQAIDDAARAPARSTGRPARTPASKSSRRRAG